MKKRCEKCGQEMELDTERHPFFAKIAESIKTCGACLEKEQQERDAAAAAAQAFIDTTARIASWELICPEEFREVDFGKLPNRKAFNEALAIRIEKRALGLIGPTSRGKTRALYQIMKREHFDGKGVQIISHDAALRYGGLFGKSAEAAWEWVEEKMTCDVLGLDDVFKSKLTDSFEQALFTIISTRMEWRRPFVLTTQDVGKTLEARMSADRGAALSRRLREFCDTVSFV